jgi:hypothetical protein
VALIIQKLPQRLVLQPGVLGPEPGSARLNLRKGLRIAEPMPDAGISGADLASMDFGAVVGQASFGRKIVLGIQSAAADFMDVAFYFVIGSSLAAVFVGLNESAFSPSESYPFLSIVTLMGLAALLCLCSTTDAFVAANSFQMFSLEANLAFLVFGPMFDLKLFFLYGLLFKRRFVLAMGLFMFAIISFVCWRLGPVMQSPTKLPPPLPPADLPAPLPAAPQAVYSRLALRFV